MRKSVLLPFLLGFLALQFAYAGGNSTATSPHPVLSYSAYLAGSGTGSANAVAVDISGHIYVAGTTASTEFSLVSASAPLGAKTNVFVSQISEDGSSLLLFNSLVGSAGNEARGIAVDSTGNIYITGTTRSADFHTRNALQPSCVLDALSECSGDVFVAKFDAQGTLVYATYLGGSGNDVANGVAVDAAGNAYITGTTTSIDFPVVAALQWAASGNGDAFVAKIAADGSHLIYGTYLGGSGAEEARGIAVDAAGNAYITGRTSSADFPTKVAVQVNCAVNSMNVCDDAFVTQISADGSALIYSTYFGGSSADAGNAIAVDASGSAYIVGETLSPDFPVVKAFQATTRGGTKAFVSKLAADGSSFLYSTYLGGSGDDRGHAIVVDSAGNAYIAGETLSSDFPLKDPVQAACKKDLRGTCAGDAFVAVLDPMGATLKFASYFGGSGTDQARGIAVDAQGAVYIVGTTMSSDFPFTTLAQLPSSSAGTQTTSVSSEITARNSGGAFAAKITEVSVADGMGTNSTGSDNNKKTKSATAAATACSGASAYWLGGTGNWSDTTKWSTHAVPNSSTANVCIDNGNTAASQVTLNTNIIVGSLTIDSGDSLTIGNGLVFIVASVISNSGQILMNGSANPTFLEMATGQNVTLTGGGTLLMGGSGNNIIAQQTSGGGSTLTNFNNIIQGAGQIGWDGLTVINQAAGVINANGGLTLNAPVVTNGGLVGAIGGGTLLVGPNGHVAGEDPVVNNAGGTIVANGSGSSVQFASATIRGGTLNIISGGVLGTQASAVARLDGTTNGTLTNAGTYTAANNSTTYLLGTINNTGVFQINGTANWTFIEMASGQNVTLTGKGIVNMVSDGYNVIAQQTTNGGSTLTNVDNTIQGAGQIGWNSLALVNQTSGVINANITSTTVGITINAPAVTNTGLIEATNGGLLLVSPNGHVTGGNPIVNNLGGTIVANGSGSSLQFDSATIQAGILNTISGGTLGTLASSTVILDGKAQGQLNNKGTYTAANNSTTILTGTINNSGVFLINATANSTFMDMAQGQNVMITGGGTVTMSNSGNSIIAQQTTNGGSTLTNVDNTIQGAGQIGWNSLALVNQASGVINANGNIAGTGITVNAPVVTNAGLMEATGGSMLLVGPNGHVSGDNPTVNNSSGSIVASGSGSSVQFGSAMIQGGTLNTLNNGVLGTQAANTAVLDGTTHGVLTNAGIYTAANNSTTYLVGTINNTGVFQINGTSNPTFLEMASGRNITLTGGGKVTMGSTGNSIIAQQTTNGGSTLTNVNNTIQGAGQIGWNSLALVNQTSGVINANITSTTVGIAINAPAVTNTGLIEATNGGLLLVSPAGHVSGGNPIVNNSGGSMLANGGGSSVQFGSATIQGGTLNTLNNGVLGTQAANTAVLDGTTYGVLTNTGTYTAANNSTTYLVGTINNTGVFQINGTSNPTFLEMASGQNVSLTGAGTVAMVGAGNSIIAQQTTNGGSTLTSANTIQGAGQIGWNGLALLNNGTILANAPNALAINGASFTNNGTVQMSGGGTLNIATGNSLMANAGNVIVNAGSTMTVTGNYTQSAGGTQVDGAFTATVVNINGGTLSGNGGTVTGPTSLAGVLRPGDTPATAGLLSIKGAYSQAAGGAYNVLVGGLSAGSQFGQVNITSGATLSGTLSATLINGFSPVAGNSFTILNASSRSGAFGATNLPALPCGGTWQVSYTSTSAVLSVVNPTPTISFLSPSSAGAGGPAFTLTVNGSGFACGSTVKFNGNARSTTFVSPTQLTAAILASDIANTGNYNVTVTNAAPGGGTSNAAVFTVNNSTPTITSVSPSSATAGDPAFTLTVNGANFVNGSTVSFNGNTRRTTFVSATQLTAAILAADIGNAGTYNVIVTTPSGGGTSNAVAFTVNNPAPTINTISPASAAAGGPAFTLTVNGTAFVSSSVVKFGSNARVTTFVSATQLTAAILASDIATAGNVNVTVINPTPGGGTSNAATFTVTGNTQLLTVTLAGTGSGTVTSSPSGINCPGTCNANFTTGTVITLTAAAGSGSMFGGWSGGCTGTGTCSITMNAAKSVTASFNGSGTPAVTLSPTSLGFGNQVINTTSTAKTVTLTNSGTGTLNISNIATSGSFAILSKTCGTTLAAAAKCTVKVTFTPMVLGALNGALTFTDNASNSPQLVALTGKGVLPATLTPPTATYSAQGVGTTSAAKTFTLTNNQIVALTSVAISASGDFAISATTCTTGLAAKTKCTISVTFTPTTTGTRTGSLTVSDSASNSPQTASLTGTGVVPATLMPTSVSYGSQAIGITSVTKTITLTNNQSGSLNNIAISTSGDFAVSATTCTTTLATKAKCTISVTFTPTTTGTRTGTLFVSDSASNSPQTSALTGTGVWAATLTPATATYASQTVGTTSPAKTFTLTNNQTVSLNNIVPATSGDFAIAATTCTTSLAPKSKCTFNVTFKPIAIGTRSGKLSVSDSANNSPQTSNLTGTGK